MSNSKLESLVHYVCARCDDPSLLGATKLNKILWYSDVLSYVARGTSITGAVYIKRQFGPVPRDILVSKERLISSGALVERNALHFGYAQKQLLALIPADISMFTSEEISIVDGVVENICKNHTATSISTATHDSVWAAADIGEEIPLCAVFSSNIGELDEEDMAWAKGEVEKIEAERLRA